MVLEDRVNLEGSMKTSIPTNPIIIPNILSKPIFSFLMINNEIRTVNKGIVPIRVAATILSTLVSLKLIKLKGTTFPKIATEAKSNLFDMIIFLSSILLQKKMRKKDAMISL
tara:strand:+ start:232 stop:567 length:336 start_codon:yes stop_codon:yes gene_type:complete